MSEDEFKDMYKALEGHHREVRLAHLTGTPKDRLYVSDMRVRPYVRSNVCIRYEGTPIRQVECMYQI